MAFKNKEEQRVYHKKWYEKNKQKRIKQIREHESSRIEETRFFLFGYFKNHPCVDCGNNNILVLEFDHLGNKKYDICELIGNGTRWHKVLKEIKKCEVVCRNCHIIRTIKRSNGYRLKWLQSLVSETPVL